MAKQYVSQEPMHPHIGETITLTSATGMISLRTTDNSYQQHIEEFARVLANIDPRELLTKLKSL